MGVLYLGTVGKVLKDLDGIVVEFGGPKGVLISDGTENSIQVQNSKY